MASIKGGLTLIQQLQKLFGARNVSDMMGRTTNVQTLAQGTNNPFAQTFSKKYLKKNPDGVEEASKVIMENMQFAFGNKNAQQMNNFQNNVNTLFEIKFPPAAPAKAEAKILDLSTKKQVTGKGIDSLKDKMGLPPDVKPDSPMGQILTQQRQMDKVFSDMGTTLEGAAKTYSTGIEAKRRAAMRQILLRDKRINLTPEEIDSLKDMKDLQKNADPNMDPMVLLNKYYKRDNKKLEILDEVIDESMRPTDAADNFLAKNDKLEVKLKRESLDDEAVEMAEQSDLDDDIPFAQGGRAGFKYGGSFQQYIKREDEYKDLNFEEWLREDKAQGGIAGQLHLNEGGRVGLEKGGPPNPGRRSFMKLMAGLATLPVFGKFFKGAKVASKVVPLKNTTTTMPAWFPDLVDKFVAKGISKKIDEDMIEYTVKELPDVKMIEKTDGMISVEGKNAYNEDYFIQYEPPGYTVVDDKTGKAVKTPGEFVATDTEYRMVSPEDYDIDGVTVNDVDELLGGSSNQLEGFAKGTGKTKNTIGQRRIDEADARGASSKDRADVYEPYEGMDGSDFADPEDYATGGRVGMLAGGSVLKTIIKNLAKEKGVDPSYLLQISNIKSLPKKVRDKLSPREIKQFLEKRIEQVENFRDMMQSRVKFNQSIQQGKALDDQGAGMSDIFDFMDESFTKGSPVPRDVSEADVLQMEQMIKNMKTKGRKLNAKGGLAGQLL